MENLREWEPVESRDVPSTYRQVLNNTFYIQETVVPVLGLILGTVLQTRDEFEVNTDLSHSDVYYNPTTQRMEVRGATITETSTNSISYEPNQYHRNLTLEFKTPEIIGLQTGKGVRGNYVLLMTIRLFSQELSDYPAWQFAFGDTLPETEYDQNNRRKLSDNQADDSIIYVRREENGTWGSWRSLVDMANILPKYQKMIANFSQTKIITSETQPAGSELRSDDYWLQPVPMRT